MTETARAEAGKAHADIETLAARPLPEPRAEMVDLETAPDPVAEKIHAIMAEIDLGDTRSIVQFGARAQADLQAISQEMLADVKTKDLGAAGDSLAAMVTSLRGFSEAEFDVRRERSLWEKLSGRAAPFARFLARYEEVQHQIDTITDRLLTHEQRLLVDIKALDRLYDKTLGFYDDLALYIAAGEAKLAEIDATEIPARETVLTAAAQADQLLRAQELHDLRAARDDLERRVHDLKLTRQVTMQSLPSIRLVQENDKSLITKINSTLVNTVPLWETQLAQAVTIQRSAEAARAVRAASDLTNELLAGNARTLRAANATIRNEMERGVLDIAAVKSANEALIATIEDSLSIADAGKRKRLEAEQELVRLESALRDTLASARAKPVEG